MIVDQPDDLQFSASSQVSGVLTGHRRQPL